METKITVRDVATWFFLNGDIPFDYENYKRTVAESISNEELMAGGYMEMGQLEYERLMGR